MRDDKPIDAAPPDWASLNRPRSFAGLVNLWESNYLRLQRLLPQWRLEIDQARSVSQTDAPLYLQVLERSPYTLTLLLTYRFGDAGELPRLRVRIYHDARVAQAMDAPPAQFGHHLERQWERNLLLNKWLEYCLSHGHGFALANCQAQAAGA